MASVGTFCLNTAQNQLAKGKGQSDAQWETIKKFRDQCRTVTQNLQNMREQFYNERAQWLEVDRLGTLSAVAPALNENKVTKLFLMLETDCAGPDNEFEGDNNDFVPKPTPDRP